MKGLFKSVKGGFLFLQEPKMEAIDAQVFPTFCPWLNFQSAICSSVGASGGILLVWNGDYWYKLDEFVGKYSVSVLLKDVRCDVLWVATSVYGPTNISEKAVILAELTGIAGLWNNPWVIGEDFNVIRFPNVNQEGCSFSPVMQDFNDSIRHHDLFNLPLRGSDFTWSNMQENPVMSRLDRFLVSTDWLDVFPDCVQRVVVFYFSQWMDGVSTSSKIKVP